MWILIGILGVLGVFLSLAMFGFALDSGTFFAYVRLLLAILATILLFVQSNRVRKRRKKERQRARDDMLERQASLSVGLPHTMGLPIAENMDCQIYSTPTQYEIVASGNQFNIEKSKISDVSLKTDTEIQKQVTSSVGGAVGGAVLFGPLGAMIGGRAKAKDIRTTTTYLIFTFSSDGEVKFVAFDATEQPREAKRFVNEFQSAPPIENQVRNL